MSEVSLSLPTTVEYTAMREAIPPLLASVVLKSTTLFQLAKYLELMSLPPPANTLMCYRYLLQLIDGSVGADPRN